jgi:hypothetical protein
LFFLGSFTIDSLFGKKNNWSNHLSPFVLDLFSYFLGHWSSFFVRVAFDLLFVLTAAIAGADDSLARRGFTYIHIHIRMCGGFELTTIITMMMMDLDWVSC